MGNDEEGKSAKVEKSSPPSTPDHTSQANIHVYPDWAAMQAYYGPRVALPAYYNSGVAPGHAPHPYMWGPPQAMMPPYGAPYAAIYPHGGVYAHPGVPLGAHGQGVPSSPAAVTPMSVETPTKSSGTEKEMVKKLKGFDSLAMSIGNGNTEGASEPRMTQSSETDGSTDGSDGNTSGGNQSKRKRSREGTPNTVATEKTENQAIAASAKETLSASILPTGITVGSIASPGMTTALELRNQALPPDSWLNNERELKRERRKQSNRESARRSRLRKQAETEELGVKVESLTAENVALKADLNRLTESSEKLRLENAKLLEKLKVAQLGRNEKIMLNNNDKPISTENLLSRVNNSGAVDRSAEEGNVYEKNSKPGAKLHQLLDANPRADVVAAG